MHAIFNHNYPIFPLYDLPLDHPSLTKDIIMTISQLTELLGWASILNIGMLISASIMLVLMNSFTASVHSKMFAIPESDLSMLYFKYLSSYKVLTFIFIITPYLSLKLMGQ